jgi:hypothetical protein
VAIVGSPGFMIEVGRRADGRSGGEISVRRWDCGIRFIWRGCEWNMAVATLGHRR